AMAEPTDRSMPPLIINIVMPIAPIATMTVCASTMRRLNGARKWSRAAGSISTTKIRITAARPTNGPSRASHRDARLDARRVLDDFASAVMFNFQDFRAQGALDYLILSSVSLYDSPIAAFITDSGVHSLIGADADS